MKRPEFGRLKKPGRAMPSADWFPDWRSETAVILASGPSAAETDLAPLASAKVITVNTSCTLWPAADVLYAADRAWWSAHPVAERFAGLKVTEDLAAARQFGAHDVFVAMGRHEILTEPRGVIGHGGNGGFQALNLAVQFGARRVVLVGFDMSMDRGNHWHPDHPAPCNQLKPQTVANWRVRLDAVAPQLASLGVTVLNASPASALTAYPKVDLATALQDRLAA